MRRKTTLRVDASYHWSHLTAVHRSSESQYKLIDAVDHFAHHDTRRPLWDFERLAGYLNWALNVNLMLSFGLSALYAKTAGKEQHRALLWG